MKYLKIALALMIYFFFFFIPTGFAEEDNLGYIVNLVQPKTQIDPKTSYFYIQTTPKEKQTLEVRVKSTRKEPVNLNIYATNAITSDGGTIEYSQDAALIDSTLTTPLTSIVTIDTPTLTVENFEEKTVHIEVNPTEDSYEGIKMGAIVFEIADEEKNKNGVSMGFAYRIGMMTSENGDEFYNGKTINLLDAKASIKRGKKMILASLQNPEPKIVEKLNIQAVMSDKKTGKVVKRKNVENVSMAPNSKFDFEMDWGIDELASGSYNLVLDISNDYENWKLEKEFTITNQQANEINKESAFKIVTPKWFKNVTVILYLVIIVISSSLLVRRVSWKKKWKKLKSKKKKKKTK